MAMAGRSQLETRIRSALNDAPHAPLRGMRAIVIVAAIAIAPFVAAVKPVNIPRPAGVEPDLLYDDIANPFSELIEAPLVDVAATGPDAALIRIMQRASVAKRRSPIDLVPDRARWALTQVRDGQLVGPLLVALRNNDWRIRAYAAWALGIAQDTRATKPIIPLLNDPVWRMRAMAAYTLAQIVDPTAHEAMVASLSDNAWQVRMCVVDYLAALGREEDRPLLEAMRTDRHMAVRSAAEAALDGR